MCNFFSALIVDKNKKCLWDSCIDSHSELVDKFKIDDTTNNPKFVRVELTPPHYTVDAFKNPESWNFKTDQDLLPDWYDADLAKKTTVEAVKEFIKDHVFFDGIHEVKEERAIFLGSSKATLLDNSKATLWGNSEATLLDNSKATLRGNSKATLRGNSKATLWGNSEATLLDNSEATLWDNSKATLWDNSKATLWDHSMSINHTKNEVCVPEIYKVVTHK